MRMAQRMTSNRAPAAALRTAIDSTRSDLATKADLDVTATALRADLAALENRLVEREIRLVKWGIGLAFAVAAVVLAGVRLMLGTGA